MRSVFMVIADVFRQKPFKMTLVEHNGVVQQFAATTSNPALCNAVLPRALNRGLGRSNPHASNCGDNLQSVLAVMVIDKKFGWHFHMEMLPAAAAQSRC